MPEESQPESQPETAEAAGAGQREAPAPAPAPPAPAPAPPAPAPKKKLTQADKIKLAARVKPMLAPALDSIHQTMDKARGEEEEMVKKGTLISDDPEELSKPMGQAMAFVIPQISQLSKVIDDEGEAIVEERIKESEAKAKAQEKESEAKAKAQEKVNVIKTIQLLGTRCDKMTSVYELSSRYYSARHFWLQFLPMQILVLAAAVLSFVAASDVKQRPSTAVVLSLIAGIIGFVVTFITTMDRHCNWKLKADIDKQTSLVYIKIRQEIDVLYAKFESGDVADATETVKLFEERLKNIEDLSGEHLIPREIRVLFKFLEAALDLGSAAVMAKCEAKGREFGVDPNSELDRYVGYANQQLVWAMANEKLTSLATWPLFLPSDSRGLAMEIVRDLQEKLHEMDLDRFCPNKEGALSPFTQPAKKPSCCATFCCARGQESDGAPPSADNV